jgi:hypothetical protein
MSAAFQRGQFRSFRATNKIHLGKYETDILQDDEFDYDGHSVRYGGMEYAVPQLRGLFGSWYVPAADQTTTYHAQPAGVKVSHATPEARERGDEFTMGEASEEEALVGTLDEQTEIRKAAAKGAAGADRLAELRARRAERKAAIGITAADVDSNPDAPPPQNAGDVDPEIEAALMEHTEQTYMKAQPVHQAGAAQVKMSPDEQAAVARANALNQQRIKKKAAELEAADPYKSKAEMGGTRHDSTDMGGRRAGKGGKFTVVEDDAGGVPINKEYRFSDGASVGDGVVERGEVKTTNVLRSAGKQPIQVGRAVADTPKNREAGAEVIDDPMDLHEPTAARARSTTQVPRRGNVGIDEIGEGGATGDVDEAMYGDDLEQLLPDAAVAGRTKPKPPPRKTEAEEIAEIVENWNTRRNWQHRVQEAVDFYGDWPEAIDAICEKESSKVAEQIRSRLARAEAAEAKKG